MFNYKIIALRLFCYIFAIFAVIINVTNIKIIGINSLIPSFEIMIIFYAMMISNFFGIWFVFILGIWSDALNSTHLGISSLSYIIVIKFFHLLYEKFLEKENFAQILLHFSIFIILFQFLKTIFLTIIDKHLYNISHLIIQISLTISLYPMLHYFFNYLDSKIKEDID